MSNLKRKIAAKLTKSKFKHIGILAQYFNFIFFHWNERMRLTHPGKMNPANIYYVINPRDKTEGLLSSYYYVLAQTKWALSQGYLPYVNFQSHRCQYYVDREIHGSKNAWEYYFTQPTEGISLCDLCNKMNVIQSGWSIKVNVPGFGKTLRETCLPENRKLISEKLKVQPYIDGLINEIALKEFYGKTVLGVFIRGTDYIVLKPKGHPVQPSIEEVINKIHEFVSKYNPDRIFVVTEDKKYYDRIVNVFGEKVFTSDNNFINGYNADGFISDSFNNDPYERGLKYLIRIILLTKCDYLVSSITNGSLFAYGMKESEYKDSYWFDLGMYE